MFKTSKIPNSKLPIENWDIPASYVSFREGFPPICWKHPYLRTIDDSEFGIRFGPGPLSFIQSDWFLVVSGIVVAFNIMCMYIQVPGGIFFFTTKKTHRNLKKNAKWLVRVTWFLEGFFIFKLCSVPILAMFFFSTLVFLGDFGGKLGVSVLVWYPAMPEQVSSDMTDEDEEALSKVNEVCLIFYTAEAGAFTRILIVERGDWACLFSTIHPRRLT